MIAVLWRGLLSVEVWTNRGELYCWDFNSFTPGSNVVLSFYMIGLRYLCHIGAIVHQELHFVNSRRVGIEVGIHNIGVFEVGEANML